MVKKIRLASLEDAMVHTSDILKWQELIGQKNKIQKLNIRLANE